MDIKEFTNLADSLKDDKILTTPKQMAEFVMLAKECVEHQEGVIDKQTIAEYASGATSRAHELYESNFDLDAVHASLLSLGDEYDPRVIQEEWEQISTWLRSYV